MLSSSARAGLGDNHRRNCSVSRSLMPRFQLRFSSSVRSGRPATGPRRRVDVRWQPYVGRGPTGQSTGPSRAPRRTGAVPIPSPSLIRLQHGETEPPLPPPLQRARARSPPHRSPPKLVHCSILNPSPSSTSQLGQLCGGKAALPSPPLSASGISRRSTPVAWPCFPSISLSSVLSVSRPP
jgi:hypothetical protein